jgi:4-hydroxy-tetrahydrodipicolinate synthase
MELKKKVSFNGIMVPTVTPLTDNDTLDVAGLERLIEHTISGGVHSIFILGTTGEFASLSYKLRGEVIRRACKIINGRKPVVVGITDSAFTESLAIAKLAADNGADALVLSPPYYFATSQPELLEYLKRIMAQLPLPVFLYNMPSHTKVTYEPATIKAAADIPGIIGLKDSSGDLAYLNSICHLLRDKSDFTFLVGREEMTSSFVVMGGHGGVNGGANLFPRLLVDLYNASLERDFEKIKPLQQKVMQLSTTIYKVGSYGSSYLKGMKCALSVMGICSDFMAEPFTRFDETEKSRIKKLLEELNYKEML